MRCTRLHKATMVVENNVMFQTLLVFMNQSHSVRVAFSYIWTWPVFVSACRPDPVRRFCSTCVRIYIWLTLILTANVKRLHWSKISIEKADNCFSFLLFSSLFRLITDPPLDVESWHCSLPGVWHSTSSSSEVCKTAAELTIQHKSNCWLCTWIDPGKVFLHSATLWAIVFCWEC